MAIIQTIEQTVETLKAQRAFCKVIFEALEERVVDGNMTLAECAADPRYLLAKEGFATMDAAINWLENAHGGI